MIQKYGAQTEALPPWARFSSKNKRNQHGAALALVTRAPIGIFVHDRHTILINRIFPVGLSSTYDAIGNMTRQENPCTNALLRREVIKEGRRIEALSYADIEELDATGFEKKAEDCSIYFTIEVISQREDELHVWINAYGQGRSRWKKQPGYNFIKRRDETVYYT